MSTKPEGTPQERELSARKFLDVMKGWSFEQFASLMASAVRHGIEPSSRRIRALEAERDALRRRLDALEAEVVRMQAKSAGGALTLAARR